MSGTRAPFSMAHRGGRILGVVSEPSSSFKDAWLRIAQSFTFLLRVQMDTIKGVNFALPYVTVES